MHPKSPELVQAQLAHYAAETLRNPSDREHVLMHLGDIAMSQGDAAVRTVGKNEAYGDVDGQTVRPQQGSEVTVMNRADYTAYLRSPDARGDKVTRRAELLTNYNYFREAAQTPGDKLGSGGSSSVRLISVDGKRYALREALSENGRHGIDSHMAVSAVVERLPEEYKQRSERLVAATYEAGGQTVAELMPGKELDQLSREEVRAIQPEHVNGMVRTIAAYDRAGLGVDPSKRANFFYDAEKGFGFVDLNIATASGTVPPPANESLPALASSVSVLLTKGPHPSTPEAFADWADSLQSTLPSLEAYQQACEELPDEILTQESKNTIKQLVEDQKLRIANYSNPQWVTDELDKQAASRAHSLAGGEPDVF